MTDDQIDALIDRHYRNQNHPDSYAALRYTIRDALGEQAAELASATRALEHVRQQASIWKQEARTQKSTVDEVGAALGGVPDWAPVVETVSLMVAALSEARAENERLRAQVALPLIAECPCCGTTLAREDAAPAQQADRPSDRCEGSLCMQTNRCSYTPCQVGPAQQAAELAAALGWPGGITNDPPAWPEMLRAVMALRLAQQAEPEMEMSEEAWRKYRQQRRDWEDQQAAKSSLQNTPTQPPAQRVELPEPQGRHSEWDNDAQDYRPAGRHYTADQMRAVQGVGAKLFSDAWQALPAWLRDKHMVWQGPLPLAAAVAELAAIAQAPIEKEQP